MKTTLSLVLVSAIVLAAVFTIRALNQISLTDAETTALASQRAELRAKIMSIEQRLQDAAQVRTDLEKTIAAARAEQSAAMATAKSAATTRRLSPEAQISNDPKKLAAYSQDFRTSLDWNYGGMVKALGLSAEQAEKFKDFKAWSEQRRLDLLAAAETNRLSPNSPAYKALQEKEAAEETKKEAEVLGDRAEQYREYNRTRPTREVVQRLASIEASPDVRLTSTQVEHATQIIAANSPRTPNGGVDRFRVNWDTAGRTLQDIVSPSQLASLRQVFQQAEFDLGVRPQAQKEIDRILAPFKAALPHPPRPNQ